MAGKPKRRLSTGLGEVTIEQLKNMTEPDDIERAIVDSALIKKTCTRCRKKQPRADFVVSFTDPMAVLDVCRICTMEMVQKPEYQRDAITNIIGAELSKNGYAGATALVEAMLNKAIHDRDLPTMKLLLERMDGPLVQKVEVTGDEETKRLIADANLIRASVRKVEDNGEVLH